MRIFRTSFCLAAILAVTGIPFSTYGQQLSGPILGYVPDDAGTAIRPVLGIPGASTLGRRLPLDASLRDITISPKQDYAIAFRIEDSAPFLIDLPRSAALQPMAGVPAGGDRISIGPSGVTAAIYHRESKNIHAVGGLPRTPFMLRTFDGTRLPDNLIDISISDDAMLVLARFETAVWILEASGAAWEISSRRPTSAAFLSGKRDAVIADDGTQSAFLVTDIGRTNARVPLVVVTKEMGGFVGVSASEDGRRVFLAGGSGTITSIDLRNGFVVETSCGCQPRRLERLKGSAVFRLTDVSGDPIRVLDASANTPRVVLIPPVVSE